MIAYNASNNNVLEQFPEFRKPIKGGNGNIQNVIDYRLSRYACYLVVQNANPNKKTVALGGTMPENLPTPEKSVKELQKEELLKITSK